MRVWYFSEMAYHPAWQEGLKRGSLRPRILGACGCRRKQIIRFSAIPFQFGSYRTPTEPRLRVIRVTAKISRLPR